MTHPDQTDVDALIRYSQRLEQENDKLRAELTRMQREYENLLRKNIDAALWRWI